MSVLDQIFRKSILKGPEEVSADYQTPHVSLDGIQDEFSISLSFENGSSVNMDLYIEFGNDGINFAQDSTTQVNTTDTSGSITWDFPGTGVQFARVSIVVTSGSLDLSNVVLIGKRNH
jgi:hypothetical protein